MSEQAMQRAIEGLEMGYRVIAGAINAWHIPQGVTLPAESIRSEDSMWQAFRMLRSTERFLPFVDVVPGRESEIFPWSLGYINESHNDEILVSLNSDSPETVEYYVGEKGALSRRVSWTVEDWGVFVVDPISIWHAKWKVALSIPKAVALGETITKPELKKLLSHHGIDVESKTVDNWNSSDGFPNHVSKTGKTKVYRTHDVIDFLVHTKGFDLS